MIRGMTQVGLAKGRKPIPTTEYSSYPCSKCGRIYCSKLMWTIVDVSARSENADYPEQSSRFGRRWIPRKSL